MNHTKVLIPILKNLRKTKDIKIYYISKDLYNRGKKCNLDGYLVNLNLVPDDYKKSFETVNNIKKRNKIYCYTGFNKLGKLYHYDIIRYIEDKLSQYEFIYSHELNVPFDKMKQIYQECFMGIRLTDMDGNANTVLELGELGIPVIHNGNQYNTIPYYVDFKNKHEMIDDIITKIIRFKIEC